MTDREILEAAAKAAGYRYVWIGWMENHQAMRVTTDGTAWSDWSPLESDADALRLAVKRGIAIVPYPCDIAAMDNASGRSWAEPRGTDPYAATRRAIVKAAASLGGINGMA